MAAATAAAAVVVEDEETVERKKDDKDDSDCKWSCLLVREKASDCVQVWSVQHTECVQNV